MAVQDLSFGPSLSRPAGAPPRGTSGGYIPVADIPNMPKADVTMPLAKYPDIPSIRYKYQEGASDMAGRIAALQQKPLPGGFAEGAERVTRAAGKGEAAMGEAISEGSSLLSRALQTVGNTFAQIAEEANRQKAIADGSRESNAWEMAEATFLARAQKEGIPPSQWWNEFQKNEGKQYNEFVGTLGANEAQKDVFRSKSISRFGGFYAKILGEDAKESWKIDDQAMKLELNTAVTNGDWNGAYAAAGRLRNSHHLTEPEYHKTLFDIGKAQDESYIQGDIKRDPAFVQEELDKVKRGESSKVYRWLKDPADVDRLYNQSKGEVNRRQIEDGSHISKDILDGTPLTEAEVVARAKAAGLNETQTDTLRKQAVESIPYDDGKTSTAMAAVQNYDPRNDKDLKEYHRIKNLIATTTSKEVQTLLLPELKQKWEDRGKTTSAQQDELDKVSDTIDQFAKNSMLYSEAGVKLPSGMGEERGEKTDIVDKEAYAANQKRRMDLRWAAREYMRQHPDFKQGELREYINGLMEPDAKQQARAAAKGTATGEKPVMRPQFVASPTGAIFRPASVPRTEPLSEEALIKREQEAQKMRMPAPGPTSQVPMQTTRSVASFNTASTAGGPQHQMSATAYVPGMGGIEGGPGVAGRSGPAYTMEQYATGTAPWVSVAMDPESPLQGKFLINARHPNVIFKVEDTGSAFKGKGESRIDIAFSDKSKATNFKEAGTFKVISEADANSIAAEARGQGRIGAAGGAVDDRSAKNIATLKPEAQPVMTSFIARAKEWARANGLDVFVGEGYRTPERQAELYAQGHTKPGNIVTNAKPGQSRHQSARAIDVVITRGGKVVDEPRLWAQLGKIGQEMGLEWGGNWKSIHDPEHFQFNG